MRHDGPRRGDIGWLIVCAVSVVGALPTIFDWAAIIVSGVPTGYGEGAVAHAGQILARGGDPYAPEPAGAFVSANYPPLAYAIAAIGAPLGPFTALRVANVTACIAVAAVAASRARASPTVALAIGASFLALFPVAVWGATARVDPIAVALTALAVVTASADPRRAAIAGLLAALALAAKPTAALPLLAVFAYLAWRERAIAVRVAAAFAVATVLVLAVVFLRFDGAGLWRHLVVYNSFPYDAQNPLFLALLAVFLMGSYIASAAYVADGRMRAYLAGAMGVVLLGGHAGATVNYLLDLAAASCVALAPIAARPAGRTVPLLAAQLAATLFLVTVGPFAPTDLATHAARVETARTLPSGPVYAEDSGILIAAGIEPVIDDPYVWAQLVALGVRGDDVTPRMRAGDFAAVVSDVALDRLEEAPQFERERWPRELVAALLQRYRLERQAGALRIYVPR